MPIIDATVEVVRLLVQGQTGIIGYDVADVSAFLDICDLTVRRIEVDEWDGQSRERVQSAIKAVGPVDGAWAEVPMAIGGLVAVHAIAHSIYEMAGVSQECRFGFSDAWEPPSERIITLVLGRKPQNRSSLHRPEQILV